MLMGRRVSLKLCGHGELLSLEPDVSVQCGAGSWTKKLDFSRLLRHADLTQWSIHVGHGGLVPKLDAPQDVKTGSYKALCGSFQMVWGLLEQSDTTTVVFFLQVWAAPVLRAYDCFPNVGKPHS